MPSRIRTPAAALVLAASAVACGDSPSNPNPQCSVSAVSVSGAPQTLIVNGTAQLTADVTSSNCTTAPTVAWSSSSDAVAGVSATGLVTAHSAGNVTITATAGGKSGTTSMEVVSIPVDEVRIEPGQLVLGSGAVMRLVAEAFDAGDNPIPGLEAEWTSSDESIAEVDDAGNVTAIMAGESAEITATIGGVSSTIDIHVVRSRIAYFWNNAASVAGAIEPDEEYSFNSVGATNLRERSGAGVYIADFGAEMSRDDYGTEAMFVSAYDPPSEAAYCRQSSWSSSALNLHCRDKSGTLTDSRWTAVHVSNGSFQGRWGFGWIPDGSQSVPASSGYSHSSAQGAINSERLGTGQYQVTFEGLGRNGQPGAEGVFVNAYAGSGTCQPGGWNADGDDLVVEVWCFKANGSPEDVAYTILVLDQPRPGAGLAYALADQPSTDFYVATRAAVHPSGSVQVNREGLGQYRVVFGGFNRSGGLKETFLVTAVGNQPGRCTIGSGGWSYGSAAGTGTGVYVNCWTTNGEAADMPFSVIGIK
ncbi:MAG TPA: Ig-like domain-containing protein [Gemmatimonadales bacterium]|nr:Ig-like domain-containing protein [Gemmatimonadales bacterium]